MPTERKLAAILSADVVGYSRLMANDEGATVKTLKAHKDLMGGLIRQHAGRVVDAVGDNLLADFPSVVDAVACAVAIQKELEGRNEELAEERRMLFRIGVNLGDVIVEEDRIYGDGVNIAARVEALAEPAGVSISGPAFDQVEGKLGLEFEDQGEHEVKNIPRPVRVYRVQVTEAHDAAAAQTVPGFGGRPAIAVLPFDNLSGDREQDYFADGIVEDLTTRLSRSRLFPVIARNSSFAFKGQPIDVQRVGRQLGAGYVIEGSVRRSGRRVRVTAQLIDVSTGHHVWAENYDRELDDVLAAQDDLCEALVDSLHSKLLFSEQRRAKHKPPQDLDAWDCCLRGLWHRNRGSKDDVLEAMRLYERAIELDSETAWPHALLSFAHYACLRANWADAPGETFKAMVGAAERAVELDFEDPSALTALGMSHWMQGRTERGIEALKAAAAVDPSSMAALSFLGGFLAISGEPEEAIRHLEKAIRLSPLDPNPEPVRFSLALAQFASGQYRACAEALDRRQRDDTLAPVIQAAAYAHEGESDAARRALDEARKQIPGLSLSLARTSIFATRGEPEFVERVLDGLRKAGLKE